MANQTGTPDRRYMPDALPELFTFPTTHPRARAYHYYTYNALRACPTPAPVRATRKQPGTSLSFSAPDACSISILSDCHRANSQ